MSNWLYRLKKLWKNVVYRIWYFLFTAIRMAMGKTQVFLIDDIVNACRGAKGKPGFEYGNNLVLDVVIQAHRNTIAVLYQDGKGHFHISHEKLDDFLCGVAELPQDQTGPIDWAETIRRDKWSGDSNFAAGVKRIGDLVLEKKQSTENSILTDARDEPGVRADIEEAKSRANNREFRQGTE